MAKKIKFLERILSKTFDSFFCFLLLFCLAIFSRWKQHTHMGRVCLMCICIQVDNFRHVCHRSISFSSSTRKTLFVCFKRGQMRLHQCEKIQITLDTAGQKIPPNNERNDRKYLCEKYKCPPHFKFFEFPPFCPEDRSTDGAWGPFRFLACPSSFFFSPCWKLKTNSTRLLLHLLLPPLFFPDLCDPVAFCASSFRNRRPVCYVHKCMRYAPRRVAPRSSITGRNETVNFPSS